MPNISLGLMTTAFLGGVYDHCIFWGAYDHCIERGLRSLHQFRVMPLYDLTDIDNCAGVGSYSRILNPVGNSYFVAVKLEAKKTEEQESKFFTEMPSKHYMELTLLLLQQ